MSATTKHDAKQMDLEYQVPVMSLFVVHRTQRYLNREEQINDCLNKI